MLGGLSVATLNHLLAQAEWAQGRLRPFAGKEARILIGELAIGFSVGNDGFLAESLSRDEPAVTISVPTPGPSDLAKGLDGLMQSARIEGEVELADALGFVLRHLRWDVEADLARLVGDIAAHRLHRTGLNMLTGLQRSAGAFEGNLREYVAEGGSVLPGRSEVDAYGERLRRLRDALARLEKRIDRLT